MLRTRMSSCQSLVVEGPCTSTLITAALVPLVAWRIWLRFRRASGRQRLSRFRGPLTLLFYGLLILVVGLANRHHPGQLVAFGLALAAGGGLAVYALKRTQFEATPGGLFYTPYGPIGISLAILFVLRLAYRLLEMYWLEPGSPRSWGEFGQSPLTITAFGLMAGYYTAYMLGLMRWRGRVLRAKRAREMAQGQGGGDADSGH